MAASDRTRALGCSTTALVRPVAVDQGASGIPGVDNFLLKVLSAAAWSSRGLLPRDAAGRESLPGPPELCTPKIYIAEVDAGPGEFAHIWRRHGPAILPRALSNKWVGTDSGPQ